MSKKTIVVAFAATVLLAGAGYAAGLNGGTPTSAPPPVGGGSFLGIGLFGGSFFPDGTTIVGIGTNGNANHVSTGTYQVIFRRLLNGCVWTGGIGFGTFSGAPPASMISVTGLAGNQRGLFVQTFDKTGTLADLPFEVHVICG